MTETTLMEIVNKSKWNLRIAVLAIFALGFVAGALSLNIYSSYSSGRRGHFEQMLDRLQLSSEQRTQVEKILSDARTQLMDEQRQRMREVREQTDQRLQTVLTPEQWEKFKQMRGEMGDWRRRRGRRF